MVNSIKSDCIPENLIDKDIVFFDGNCVLCHRMVRLILKVDQEKHFLLCSQQSEFGRLVLGRHGINVDDLSTVYVVKNCGTDSEAVIDRSRATLYVMSRTKKYGFISKLLSMLPVSVLDLGYKVVAKIRYRIFGKSNEACTVASAEDQARIIA